LWNPRDTLVKPLRFAGDALSIESDDAMQLLESIMAMDESRSLTERLVPRHGLAVFAHGSADRTRIAKSIFAESTMCLLLTGIGVYPGCP
jgi:hypothetical protein